MKLYTFFRSSASFRVRIALNLKGLAYDPALISLPKGEHLAAAYTGVNPSGLVPALQDGDQLLTQSLAIMEYLDEVHPGPKLMPTDPLQRAYVRALSQLIACEIHPLNNLRVLNRLKQVHQFNQDAVNEWYRHWIAEGFVMLEGLLKREARHGKYVLGDTVTMADCCLVPQVFNAQRYKCDMTAYPTVMRIHEACSSLEPFAAAHPLKQPDAPKT
jgi:maleylacetoacetate isomerase